MEVTPPKFAEAVVRWILPPSSAEHVLGDLQERMQDADPESARRRYVLDAITTVPAAILGRIRFDLRLVALYLAAQYALFVGFLVVFPVWGGPHLLATPQGWIKIGWCTVGAVLLRLIQDAYRPPDRFYRFFGVMILIVFAALWEQGAAFSLLCGFAANTRLLDRTREYFEKYFSGPQDRRTS